MKPDPRPVYLNLLRIHQPVTAWVSLLHRVSGALLVFAFPLGVWLLSRSLADEAGYAEAVALMQHPLMRSVALLGVAALAHHFFAGLRHLALDVHLGSGLGAARMSAAIVLIATASTVLLMAWGLFL